MKKFLMIPLLLSSSVAMADDFDITMDVVGASESFDQVIVNHIALPFVQSGANKHGAQLENAAATVKLDDIGGLVSEGLSSSNVERGIDSPGLNVERVPLGELRGVLGN